MDNVIIGLFITVLCKTEALIDYEAQNLPISEITDNLIKTLGVDVEGGNKRFKDLKEKLDKIKSFTVDKDKYAELLMNETVENNLNATSFYEALKQPDSFQFLAEETPKNLYHKMKEKMTRENIEEIVAKSNAFRSARRGGDASEDEADIDEAIDRMIADPPQDTHKFKEANLDHTRWDPEPELRARAARRSGRRIYRGERTSVRDYPFMVAVQVMGRFWCGGVIYYRDLVLTSAACLQLMHNNRFYRENPRVLAVRVGSNHSRLGGELVDALEVYFHPSYNPRTLANNLAVIRLRRHLHMDYHRIPKSIALSPSEDPPPFTSEVLLLGWGVKRSTQKLNFEPVFMQQKFLPVYPNVFCKEAYGDKFITNKMFCAGTMSTGEGACDHDAGGPALLAGELVGIISFGPSTCGFAGAPTVFTLVGAYTDWIETVNETKPEYYTARKSTTPKPSRVWRYSTTHRMRQHRHQTPSLITPVNEDKPRIEVRATTEKATTEVTTTKVTTTTVTTTVDSKVLWLPGVRAVEQSPEKKKSKKRKRRL